MESVHFRNGMLNKISNGIHPNYLDLGMMSNKEVSLTYLPFVRLDEQVRLGRGTISRIEPFKRGPFEGSQILFKLVPRPDGSCSGFTESILPLLTSSNEGVATSSFSMLFYRSDVKDLIRDVKTGISDWKNKCPTFQKRGQLILAKLREDGLMDAMEIRFRCNDYDFEE
ncbi:hypothetical protein BLNAU_9805 [Blattamonas nauphoetae]|uniref:Uncharacterized protein n=1 Tax=Blattamonas nauphoetae TaxID=2049346 RepID=A0ABQ9XUU2_9EUKA|nr:hypothetical protein BLNAU_9805 [Blattamonas nauphoetae]